MAAWGLVLGTLIPLQLAGAWFQSRLAASVAALLKTRLLRGAMRLDPDRLRREGAGFLFGRVVEAETFESLALGGAFPALVGVVELPIAMVILAAGAGGVAHAVVLCAFVAITAAAGAVLHRARDRVTDARLDLTRGLVERMLGHRTRLVQLARERWSEEEDPELVRYADLSRHMDRWTALIGALPRSWLVASLACLAWPWMRAADPMGLAIGLGGTLLAADSLANLVTGMPSLSGAIIAWRRVAPVAEAAVTGDAGPRSLAATWAWDGDGRIPTFTPTFDEAATKTDSLPLLSVKNITYQYPGRVHPALVAANLEIGPGDRVRSRRSLRSSPAGAGRTPGPYGFAGLRATHWAPRPGGEESWPCRSFMKITSSPNHSPSTCSWDAHGHLAPEISSWRARCAPSWASAISSSECPRDSSNRWGKAAGSSRTANGAGSSWPGRFSRAPTWSCSMRLSERSTRRA
jgi:ATP-binding cassette subfamily B protein